MKKLLSVFLVACLVVSLAACGAKTEPAGDATTSEPTGDATTTEPAGEPAEQETATTEGEEIIIGGLAPLTGDVSQYGQAVINGAKLAVEDINAAGGVLGKQIKFVVEDEQGDPTEAINAYTKLYENDKMIALVGDVTTKPTIAVAQKAAVDGIPMITASATGEDVTKAGENVFRACFIDPYQGQLMANYSLEKLGAKTAAVLYDTGDDYSVGIAEAFKAEAEKIGLEVVSYEGYPSKIDDFNAQLTLIKGTNPDVIMTPCYYEDASKIISQARSLGITSKFLGSDGWDGVLQQIDKSNVDVLKDAYYCSQYSRQSDKPELVSFIERYNETYKMEENMFAVLGYDTMMIMAASIEKAGNTDSVAIVDAMKTLEYAGLTGTTTFDENRNPVREAYITIFENGESKVLETYSFS